MSDTHCTTEAYFQTSDHEDGTFSIWAHDPTGKKLSLGNCHNILLMLDLHPSTSVADADALSTLLRKHVKSIRLQSM
ncbi:hypothetical protein [Tunturiibacter gelidoferens]|uniref:Uncharacterized protein n=1 Tax=Tunturiibacter gelidiferens TaxID=3069689 RepID=A0A9X0QGY1_9BACT|nr:hypothetical protein [Edaphobacter lichenicola]MBB5329984.1 hypothetical protein [Edaphobacter lichenicola]